MRHRKFGSADKVFSVAGVVSLEQEAVCDLLSEYPLVGEFLVDSQQGCPTIRPAEKGH